MTLFLVIGWFAGVYFVKVDMTHQLWAACANMYLLQQMSEGALYLIDDSLVPTSVR